MGDNESDISGLYHKHIHDQMSVIFQAIILAMKNVHNLWEKISIILYLHSQMSIITDTLPWLQTFGYELYVYKTEMQFYGHMTMNHLFIIQGTGLSFLILNQNKVVGAA